MFKNISAVFTLLPKVVAVVTLIEPLFDAAVPGKRKKDAALEALRAAGVPEVLIGVAEDLVDLVVSVFNAIGVFKKSDGTAASVDESELSAEAAAMKRAATAADMKLDDLA